MVLQEHAASQYADAADVSLSTPMPFISSYVGMRRNDSNASGGSHICHQFLEVPISVGVTSIRAWDVAIFIPNCLIVLLLLSLLCNLHERLRVISSANVTALYVLVLTGSIMCILRSILTMAIPVLSNKAMPIIDTFFWILVKCCLVSCELSILTFGLIFSREYVNPLSSVKRVLLVTGLLSLVYSTTQGALEFTSPDAHYRPHGDEDLHSFSHGGVIFWLCSSIVFFIVYTMACCLPILKARCGCMQAFSIPAKRSFYIYTALLALMNLLQIVGTSLLKFHNVAGMCVLDLTSYYYFAVLPFVIYFAFLRPVLSANRQRLLPDFPYNKPGPGNEDDVSTSHVGAHRFTGMYSPEDEDDYMTTSSLANTSYMQSGAWSFDESPSLAMVRKGMDEHDSAVA